MEENTQNTTPDVQTLRELDKQATEGPWICEMVSNDDASWVIGTAVDAHDNPVAGVVEREHSEFITPIYAVAESTNPIRQDGQLICAMRNALPELLERVAFLERVAEQLTNRQKHDFWGAGEPDCPKEIKAPNGELHTLRCKLCGGEDYLEEFCPLGADAAQYLREREAGK